MLSPSQRPLCVAGRLLGERKRNRAGHESSLTSLGLRFVGRVDSALFLDLRFCHPVWLSRCQYRKLLLVFYQQVKKGRLKDTRQDTTRTGHFNIQEKRYWPGPGPSIWWRIQDKTRLDHMTQNALATQNNEALWQGNGRQLFCTVLCYNKNKQLIIKDSLLCPWGKTAITFSLN